MHFIVYGLKHAKPQVWSLRDYQFQVKLLGKHTILVLVVMSAVLQINTVIPMQTNEGVRKPDIGSTSFTKRARYIKKYMTAVYCW